MSTHTHIAQRTHANQQGTVTKAITQHQKQQQKRRNHHYSLSFILSEFLPVFGWKELFRSKMVTELHPAAKLIHFDKANWTVTSISIQIWWTVDAAVVHYYDHNFFFIVGVNWYHHPIETDAAPLANFSRAKIIEDNKKKYQQQQHILCMIELCHHSPYRALCQNRSPVRGRTVTLHDVDWMSIADLCPTRRMQFRCVLHCDNHSGSELDALQLGARGIRCSESVNM